jgi:hypothetical protein
MENKLKNQPPNMVLSQIWTEVVIAYIKVLNQQLPEGTKEKSEKSHLG